VRVDLSSLELHVTLIRLAVKLQLSVVLEQMVHVLSHFSSIYSFYFVSCKVICSAELPFADDFFTIWWIDLQIPVSL
jgi:hypothetical protein